MSNVKSYIWLPESSAHIMATCYCPVLQFQRFPCGICCNRPHLCYKCNVEIHSENNHSTASGRWSNSSCLTKNWRNIHPFISNQLQGRKRKLRVTDFTPRARGAAAEWCHHLANSAKHNVWLILPHWHHYVKTQCHPKNGSTWLTALL